MEHIRKCIVCGEYKNRDEMIKITKDHSTGKAILEPDSKTFGRSAYLCYNQNCIDNALKKNKLNRVLKTTEDLKGLIDNGKLKSKRTRKGN